MFIVEYVYVPLWGNAYVTSDVCGELEVTEYGEREMQLELSHLAFDLNGKTVKFKSLIVIPKQRITIRPLTGRRNVTGDT